VPLAHPPPNLPHKGPDTSPLMGEASEACRFSDLAKLGGGGAAGRAL